MRFPGYCTECRNFKHVAATPAQWSISLAIAKTISGRCQQCESRAPRIEPKVNRPVVKTRLILKPLEK